jgi:hypothetical protein
MSDSEKIEKLEARVAALEAEREEIFAAINSLRHNPALDVVRLDRVMQGRYGVQQRLRQRV